MEKSCTWLVKELSDGEPSSLCRIYERHRSQDDSFDLQETLTFLPDKSQPEVASLIQEAIAKTTTTAYAETHDSQKVTSRERDMEGRTDALKAGIDMTWFLVQNRKNPPNASLRELIVYLHEKLLSTTHRQVQNQISKICEWMWSVSDPQREEIVPCTMLYLLLRSFGEESKIYDPSYPPSRKGGTATDVRRVYAMRKALNALNLSPSSSHAETLRTLLLRCTSSAVYLRVDEGRKFLAHLLTVEDVQNAVFDALVNQLATVKKHSARLFGIVFLVAWKVQRSDWLAKKLMKVSEFAIRAGSEPYASNLRTVLSAFHANKRVNGVDLLLNRIYGPVLFGNLMVANAVVRRNAVMILADAFPIHDPGELREEIAKTIGYQCSKLLELLEDPSPIVRKASVEGTCRVLGLFWDLVPLASAKRMIDIITSKLAFDTSAAQVRLAVFEGIEFMVQNHLAGELLSRAVPRLKNLIHDKVERVRLAFLDLLISVKAKRMQSLRYFDIVPVEDLLLRLPKESTPAATKIMNLIVTSYFPLEKKDKTSDEIALSRRRACLSMLGTSKEAAKYFYKHVNLHVPPGPLCEFVMTIAEAAVEAHENIEERIQDGNKKGRRVQRKSSRRRLPINQENIQPRNENTNCGDENDRPLKPDNEISRSTLFGVVADVLVAISPSLQKEKNKPLRTYLDRVFGGDALKPMLTEQGNSLLLRATVWRMAGCISESRMRPIITIWREQMDSVMDLSRDSHADVASFHELLAALMSCGIRWKLLPTLSAVISGWSDGAITGCRTSTIGAKTQKKARGSTRAGSTTSKANRSPSMIRKNALFALRACSNILLENNDFRELFLSSIAMDSSASSHSEPHEQWTQLISTLRKGSLGALDHSLESEDSDMADEAQPGSQLLLGSLADTWKTALMFISSLQYDERAYKEMRELLQWCAGDELWLRAFSQNEPFGVAMISLCLGFSADVVALGNANEQDLLCIEKLAQHVKKITDYEEKVLSRAILEILRIAFMLREQYVLDCNDDRASSKSCASGLRRTAASMLKLALDVLMKCEVSDERLTGVPAKQTVLEKFICGVMLEMQREGDPSDFQQVFSSCLLSVFGDCDTAEHNLLASTLCNIFTTLVTSASDAAPSNACELFSAVVTCMRFGALGPPSDKAVVSFTGFTLSALFQRYTNTGDTTKGPTVGARQFFAHVQDMIGSQFPETEEDSDASQEVPEELHEIRSTLNALRNLTEKDVETIQHRDDRARVVLNFDEEVNNEDKNEER
ncbi:Condensin-2 complex subunit G2 [Gracilariopsis chorda]|uniref:Condensin-2 complex subunit G2 n=1 Tax=Gracilariopsis chorda TaxID=448386 RepID=A0A2V3IJ39_9FLOR|nr:Condensin-2 complex subunit G2 [Gracilariopsis chorda]|eukprot:PXF42082.1 Condensin-2 complex subunit G2 [Gracilariopsis chorda]